MVRAIGVIGEEDVLAAGWAAKSAASDTAPGPTSLVTPKNSGSRLDLNGREKGHFTCLPFQPAAFDGRADECGSRPVPDASRPHVGHRARTCLANLALPAGEQALSLDLKRPGARGGIDKSPAREL